MTEITEAVTAIDNAIYRAITDAIWWPETSAILDAIFDGVAQSMPTQEAIVNAIADAVANAMPTATEIAAAIADVNRPSPGRRRSA